MSVQACAEIVARGDPDRFMAAMAAPVTVRAVLFPIYAFNVEVARAPWVTEEPMIAEMRLQWWRDALDEIGAGGAVRRHEVVDALAPILDAEGARLLDALIEARRWDIERAAFADSAAFDAYIEATAGHLTWVAARACGLKEREEAVRGRAWAAGLANWFIAIPELEARGRKPLVDGRPEAVSALAKAGLARMRQPVPAKARPVLLATWRARAVLRRAATDPTRVAQGMLVESEFRKRLGLMAVSLGARL